MLEVCDNVVLSRTQKMTLEYNEKIETVNRERKFHQVTYCSTPVLNLNQHDHTVQASDILFLISKTLVDNSMP